MDIRDLQTGLKSLGLYTRAVDGDYGPRTDDAVAALFMKERIKGYEHWSDVRQALAAQQLLCRMAGIEVGDVDGLIGPQTRHAFEVFDARKANGGKPVAAVENWRDEADKATAPAPSHPLPPAPVTRIVGKVEKGPAWPRQSGVESFFGAIGRCQATLTFPYPMRLAWDLDSIARTTSCHEKVKESLERIFVRTLEHYTLAEIKRLRLDRWGGCLAVRKMRGGSAWSMHSWGIAADVDPDHNQLNFGRDKATLDDVAYDPFWGFVYDEGAISLGRERNYDWMHFQFARL